MADAAGEVSLKYVGRAIDEGTPPAVVADHVLDAVRAGRYWVFPNPDFVEIAMDRFQTHRRGLDPQPGRADARHAAADRRSSPR